MAQIVVWGTGGTTEGRFKPSKTVASAAIVQLSGENLTTAYIINLSNWNMGGSEFGAFSRSFSYAKRLRLNDLIYVGYSFFINKTIIYNGASGYGNNSLGYVACEWRDLAGNSYYSIFAQTTSVNHYFNINTLNIKDSSNNWEYYNDRYRDGTIGNPSTSGTRWDYTASNWNSSGSNFAGFSRSFNTPVTCTVTNLISFRGAYTGNGTVVSTGYASYYPATNLSYSAIQLSGTNGQTYIAIVGQWGTSFSINTFTLTSGGFTYYQGSWNNGGYGGSINNPDSSSIGNPPYEGAKNNPMIGNGCAIAVTYNTPPNTQINLSSCPAWVRLEDDQACPAGSCECVHGGYKCCIDPASGVVVKKIRLV